MKLRRAIAVVCVLAAATAAAGDGPGSPAPHSLIESEIGSRLRVFAGPGDFALSNDLITAVVRKRDGWLTELWRNHLILPTTGALGTLTDVDAVWQIHPIVRMGDVRVPVMASRVSALADGIEVEGSAELKGVRYHMLTTHRLHPSEARLSMTTTVSVEGDGPSGPVDFGDEVKWGNTTYYVDVLAKPRNKYFGPVRWIGRRGAGGDLMLRPLSSEKMWIEYEASSAQPGFQGPIAALYWRKGLKAGKSVTFRRELSFEPLPIPPPAPIKNPGQLLFDIRDENGKPLAAKIRIARVGGKGPLFEPEGGLDGTDSFVWTGNGHAERELAAGEYRLLITAGIERDADHRVVRLGAGKSVRVDAHLPRVIATPGWVAADLHLHQAPSVDADIGLPERVIAIAAEGVEFAVATDHYVVTDLSSAVGFLRDRGLLSVPLQTMPGCEVSTLGNRFGHFNVFPLALDQRVESESTTAKALFEDARKKSPDGVLQVNHPRWAKSLGYFTAYNMDDKGEAHVPGYDPRFDTLEVYNGKDAFHLGRVRKVFVDWLHLLGRGQRYAATGSSDSHNLAFLDPGLPRTLIHWGTAQSDDADPSAPATSILAALKAGRAIVTSGPVIEASIAGAGPGETARGVGKTAHVHVVVKAAPWVDVRKVEVFQGGSGFHSKWTNVARKTSVLRVDQTFDFPLDGKTFFVVAAQGERGLPNAARVSTVPFAFTNPIWVEP